MQLSHIKHDQEAQPIEDKVGIKQCIFIIEYKYIILSHKAGIRPTHVPITQKTPQRRSGVRDWDACMTGC